MKANSVSKIEHLRRCLATMDGGRVSEADVLPFAVKALDEVLPKHGLPLGTLHEFSGAGGLGGEAAATLFVAGILARMGGTVIWCLTKADLFAPALCHAGLDPHRIIFVEGTDEKTILMIMEEGLHHPGLAGVVGELKSLSMTASRRLHLAARSSGVTAFVLKRHESTPDMSGEITAAASRWRISCAPSSPLPVAGVGRARWLIELRRCRDGEPAQWVMEACDAEGHLAYPAELADRSLPQTHERSLSA